MVLDFSAMDRRTAYFWMASTITPRPVAWVSTRSADGRLNLAPFSFFQMVTPAPPTLMICPQHHPDGSLKDTARNIRDTGEFVVSIVPHAMVDQMNETSFAFAEGENEFEAAGVAALASQAVAPPRVAGSPMSFECKVASFAQYPEASPACAIILGEVVVAHADPGILAEDGTIDPVKLDTVSRMGADWYGRTNSNDNFILRRPAGWSR